MSQWLKRKTEAYLFELCKKKLINPSLITQKVFEPLQTRLTLNQFKRNYILPTTFKTGSQPYSDEIKRYWKEKLGIYINPVWHHILSSYTDIYSPRYITDEVWSTYIHNSLNFPPYHDPLIADKNFLDLYIGKEHLPKTIIKRIDGSFYDADNNRIDKKKAKDIFFQSDSEKFLKPSRLYKGIDALKIQTVDNKIIHRNLELSFEQLTQKAGENFIIQYVVEQHPKIASVHPASLNTMRMFTLKLGTEVHFLHGSLKFGADDNVADNTGNGILCTILNDKHTLSDMGFNRKLETFKKHPSTGYELSSFGKIPNYQNAIDLCVEIHSEKLFHNFAAWDVTITKDGSPLIIELNSKVAMFLWQVRFKEPFFGDLTEEVLQFAKKKSIHLSRPSLET